MTPAAALRAAFASLDAHLGQPLDADELIAVVARLVARTKR